MAAEGTFAGRSLAASGLADDHGGAPPDLLDALARGDARDVVRVLLTARVLIPVVAVLADAEVGEAGLVQEKSADMAVVTVRAPSGRLALPAFSSVTALAAWSSDARPVAVAAVLAARAVYDEGADALLLDPSGPARAVLDGALLRALAEGRAPVAPLDDPDVHAAVAAAAVGAGLQPAQVRLEPGEGVDLVVRLTVGEQMADADAAAVAQALGAALAADPVVAGRLERGLDLTLERG